MSCYSFFDKANDGDKVIDRVLGKEISFWDKYINVIVWSTLILAVFLVVVLVAYFENRSVKRKKRMISLNGTYIDSAKVCRITLLGFKEISIVKGNEFVAPLHFKDGFDFGGWFYDSACTEPYKTTRITEDITLYPKWTKDS